MVWFKLFYGSIDGRLCGQYEERGEKITSFGSTNIYDQTHFTFSVALKVNRSKNSTYAGNQSLNAIDVLFTDY